MYAPFSPPPRRPGQLSAGKGRGELPLWAVLVVASGVLALGLGSAGDPSRSESGGALSTDLAQAAPAVGSASGSQDVAGEAAQSAWSLGASEWAASSTDWAPLGGPGMGSARMLALSPESADLRLSELPPSGVRDGNQEDARHVDISIGLGGELPEDWVGNEPGKRLGLREEGEFHQGIRHGDWRTLRRDGSLQSQGRYEEGLRVGLWETFSAGGMTMTELNYENGSREGDWRSYSGEGQVLVEGQYTDNTATGRWSSYYSGGKIKERGLFVNGLREGTWEFYDDLGLPTVQAGDYRAGIKIQ